MAVITPRPPCTEVTAEDGAVLELRREPSGTGRPVLLLHGASAASDTFRIGERQTFVDYLLQHGFDVWTLDWRAGMRCAPKIYCANEKADKKNPEIFTVDAAARHDVPAAIKAMRNQGVQGRLGIVGHCMGAAIVAQGIALGWISEQDVEHVVLTGIALFYRAAIDDMLKAQDQVLEELLETGEALLHPTNSWDQRFCSRDPVEGDWNPLLQQAYDLWVNTPFRDPCASAFCHRLSYMFGMPYLPRNIPSIHEHHLRSQFGDIPVQFLLHCAQNLRRGHAGKFVSATHLPELPPDTSYLNAAAFRNVALTLITGNLNCLWHRDAMDSMYEWLRRGRLSDQPRRLRKHVLQDFGHQDLYWGCEAPAPGSVFELILEGLGGRGDEGSKAAFA